MKNRLLECCNLQDQLRLSRNSINHPLVFSFTLFSIIQEPEKFKRYMIDPSTFVDIPACVDLSQNYVLDESAPRSELGLGVSSIELAAGLQHGELHRGEQCQCRVYCELQLQLGGTRDRGPPTTCVLREFGASKKDPATFLMAGVWT